MPKVKVHYSDGGYSFQDEAGNFLQIGASVALAVFGGYANASLRGDDTRIRDVADTVGLLVVDHF